MTQIDFPVDTHPRRTGLGSFLIAPPRSSLAQRQRGRGGYKTTFQSRTWPKEYIEIASGFEDHDQPKCTHFCGGGSSEFDECPRKCETDAG